MRTKQRRARGLSRFEMLMLHNMLSNDRILFLACIDPNEKCTALRPAVAFSSEGMFLVRLLCRSRAEANDKRLTD